LVIGAGNQADHGAAAQALVGGGLVVQHAGGELERVAAERDHFAATAIGLDLSRAGIQYQRWRQVVDFGDFGQRVFVLLLGILGELLGVDELLGTTIAVTPIVVEHALAQAG